MMKFCQRKKQLDNHKLLYFLCENLNINTN